MEKEIWKDIKGYERLYQVSNKGRIKSLNSYGKSCVKILTPILTNRKYLSIGLYKNKKIKKYLIHRLVAEAFIPNINNQPCVNHIDENRLNNDVTNLEWCDVKYNNCYGKRLDNVSKKNILSKPVIQYSLNDEYISEWENTRFAIIGNNYFEKNNPNLSTMRRCIHNCCEGQRKTAYKYKWKYKERASV